MSRSIGCNQTADQAVQQARNRGDVLQRVISVGQRLLVTRDRVLSFELGKRTARRVQTSNEFGAIAARVPFSDLTCDTYSGSAQLILQAPTFVPGQ